MTLSNEYNYDLQLPTLYLEGIKDVVFLKHDGYILLNEDFNLYISKCIVQTHCPVRNSMLLSAFSILGLSIFW